VPKNLSELRWLWRHVRPFRNLLKAQLACVLLSSVLSLLDPLIIKWLIDEVLPWHRSDMLVAVSIVFVSTYLFWYGFNSLAMMLDAYLNQRVMLSLRMRLLRHVQRLSADFFVKTPPGELLYRLEQDVDQLRELGGGTLASLVRIAVTTTLTTVILLVLNWRLTLMVLPLVPLMMGLRSFALPRLRKLSDQVASFNGRRSSFLQDHFHSIVEVQLLRREAGERRRYFRISREGLGNFLRRRAFELAAENSTNVLMMLATGVVLGYGGKQVLDNALTIGGLVAFYTYLSRIFGPTQTLVALYSAVQRSTASIRRLMKLMEVKATIRDPARPRRLPAREAFEVKLEDVAFSYGDQPVLGGLSLAVRPGEAVALVGRTGSGKSTIGRLLTRLYEPQHGTVKLNGVSVRDVRLRDLRQRVALVPQEPVLFDATLRDNLCYGDPSVDEERLWEVLRLVQLESTVHDLPEGLETPLGVRGQKLSGGQKQRLAIGRAILQRPRLLILDEATSGLDGITEHTLLRALEPLTTEMTILLIAHRLSAIRWSERILLLDGGRLSDQGRYEELMLKSPLFRELCEKQLQSGDLAESEAPAKIRAVPGVELE